jgi:hypothetical protein
LLLDLSGVGHADVSGGVSELMHNFCIIKRPFGVNGLVSPLIATCPSSLGKDEQSPALLFDEAWPFGGDDGNSTVAVVNGPAADADTIGEPL